MTGIFRHDWAPPRLRRFTAWWLVGLCLLFPAYAQEEADSVAYALKASWLTKFMKYMEWPEGRNRPDLVIGILGEDPFGGVFAPVEDKPFMGRRLTIVRFGAYQRDLDLVQCDLLFIAASEHPHFEAIFEHIGKHPVLTVSEYRGFADEGGLINFLPMKRNHIRYEVNQRRAEMLGFRVTTPLLRYADRVITRFEKGRM